MDDLEALAQKRSRLKKLREKMDPFGKAFERKLQTFSPEASTVLDKLRTVDDNIREIAMGLREQTSKQEAEQVAGGEGQEPIPGADPGQTLKDLLRVAQTNFNRREYMVAISYLGRFHHRMEMINQELEQLKNVVDTVHQRFLFDDVDPEHMKYLTQYLGPKFEKYKKPETKQPKKATIEYSLTAEGGITDWWHNITTDRGKSLTAWEKRFPRYVKEIKAQTNSIIARSQALFDNLLTTLKQLDSYRSARKIEDYIKASEKWQDRFKAFHSAFLGFYNGQIKRFIDYQKSLEEMKKNEEASKEQEIDKGDRAAMNPNEPAQWPAAGEMPAAPGEKEAPGTGASPIVSPQQGDEIEKLRKLIQSPSALPKQHTGNTPNVFFPPAKTLAPRTTPLTAIPQAPAARMMEPKSSPPPHPEQPTVIVETPTKMSPGTASHIPFQLVNKKTIPVSEDEIITEIQARPPSHAEFLSKLESMSSQHPMIQAVEISKYADSIAESNPDDSANLRVLAASILRS